MEKIESDEWLRPSPIGFYFAKLWYYERLYPMIFTVAALARARDYLARVATTQRSRLSSERSSFARRFLIVSTSLVSSKTVR